MIFTQRVAVGAPMQNTDIGSARLGNQLQNLQLTAIQQCSRRPHAHCFGAGHALPRRRALCAARPSSQLNGFLVRTKVWLFSR